MNLNEIKYRSLGLFSAVAITTITLYLVSIEKILNLKFSTFQDSLMILILILFSAFLTVKYFNKKLINIKSELKLQLEKSKKSIQLLTKENEILDEDIGTKISLNEELLKEIEYCETILNNLPEFVLVTNESNEIIYSNNFANGFLSQFNNINSTTKRIYDNELHKKRNMELLNSQKTQIDFENQDFYFQKQLFDLNKRKYILTIGEDRKELNLVNDKLVKTVNQLKDADADLNIINHKFNQLLDFISNIEDIKKIEINSFLIKVFNFIFTLIDRANCGSVYIYEDGLVNFLSAKGHDIDLLKKITIFQEDFSITHKEGVVVTKQIINKSKEYYKKQIAKASLPIKETLSFPIKLNNLEIGSIALDITEDSEEHFSKEDIQMVKPIEKLINIIINIVNQKEKNIKFTDDILNSFMELLSIHSQKLYRHSKNVGNYASSFAKFLKLDDEKINEVYWSGLMHDLGFLGIPKEELKNPIESELFYKEHVTDAFNIMSKIKGLENVALNILCHHENYDGSGYPDGRKGNEIPIISQIIGIINFYDYSIFVKNQSFDTFFNILEEKRNVEFDSELIDQLIEWVHQNEKA